jgi:hypothetical protein
LPVEDEGIEVVSTPTALNFIGSAVTVTNNGDVADITILEEGTGDVIANGTLTQDAIILGDDNTTVKAENTITASANQLNVDGNIEVQNSLQLGDESQQLTGSNPGLNNGYLSSAEFYDSFSVGNEISGLTSIYVTPNGKRLFANDDVTDTIYQYDMTIAHDIATTAYNSVSFTITNLDDLLGFGDLGNFLYAGAGAGTGFLNQYSLASPFDISSPTLDSTVSIPTATRGFLMRPDGLRFYLGRLDGTIEEYSLSTQFDISTNSLIITHDFSSDLSEIDQLRISNDGRMLYLCSEPDGFIDAYLLTTPYDLSTAEIIFADFAVTNLDSIYLDDTLSELYVGVRSPSSISQYHLLPSIKTRSFASEQTTAISVNGTLTANSIVLGDSGTTIKTDDGISVDTQTVTVSKDIEMGNVTNYVDGSSYIRNTESLSPGGSVVSLEFYNLNVLTPETTTARGIAITPGGDKIFTCENGTGIIYQFNLSTPFDSATAVYSGNSFDPTVSAGRILEFSYDGLFMYVGSAGLDFKQFSLTAPFDISSPTLEATANAPSGTQNAYVKPDGSRVYFVTTAEDVREYEMTTKFDLSTLTFVATHSFAADFSTTIHGIFIAEDGRRLYLHSGVVDEIITYSLCTPWDISTAIRTNSFIYPAENYFDLVVSESQTELYFARAQSSVGGIAQFHIPLNKYSDPFAATDTTLQGRSDLRLSDHLTYSTTTDTDTVGNDAIIYGAKGYTASETLTISSTLLGQGSTDRVRDITISDEEGNASTFNQIVDFSPSTIDGSSTATINTDYGTINAYGDGTEWFSR